MKRQKVIVEISGGIVAGYSIPEGIDLIIQDFDISEETETMKKNDLGDCYEETELVGPAKY